jgi:hypothetical protein
MEFIPGNPGACSVSTKCYEPQTFVEVGGGGVSGPSFHPEGAVRVGCRVLAAVCWLPCVGCRVLAAVCWLSRVGCRVLAVACWLSRADCGCAVVIDLPSSPQGWVFPRLAKSPNLKVYLRTAVVNTTRDAVRRPVSCTCSPLRARLGSLSNQLTLVAPWCDV